MPTEPLYGTSDDLTLEYTLSETIVSLSFTLTHHTGLYCHFN